jgi:hypothetical protein
MPFRELHSRSAQAKSGMLRSNAKDKSNQRTCHHQDSAIAVTINQGF